MLLEQRQPDSEAVMVVRVEEVEMDEMWSFVGSKQQSAVVVARHRPSNRKSPCLRVGNARRCSAQATPATQSPVLAQAILHG